VSSGIHRDASTSFDIQIDRKKALPPGGVLCLVVSKSRTQRKRTPPKEPNTKYPFYGWFLGGVLSLRVLD